MVLEPMLPAPPMMRKTFAGDFFAKFRAAGVDVGLKEIRATAGGDAGELCFRYHFGGGLCCWYFVIARIGSKMPPFKRSGTCKSFEMNGWQAGQRARQRRDAGEMEASWSGTTLEFDSPGIEIDVT
jgi:hypothetical protein